MWPRNRIPKKDELGSLKEADLKKILDNYDDKVGLAHSDGLQGSASRYDIIRGGWDYDNRPQMDKKGEIKWSKIDLKRLLGKNRNVPNAMYISNNYVAYKIKGDMYSHWRVGDLYMLRNDIIKNEGKTDSTRGWDLMSNGDDITPLDVMQGRTNTNRGYYTSGWNYVKQGFEDWYKGDLKTYHGEYRDGGGQKVGQGIMGNEKKRKRFETYNVPERLLDISNNIANKPTHSRSYWNHPQQINSVANFNADVWREAFAGADSFEVLHGRGLSDPFYNVQWWPSKGGNFQFDYTIPFEDAFGLIDYEDIAKEFKGTPIGYKAETQVEFPSDTNTAFTLFGEKENYTGIKSKLKRNLATFPEDFNSRGESINFAQNTKKSKNKDGTMKNKLQWKNNRAVIFNPNSTFQFARTFGNKKGQKIRYVSRKAGDGLVIWREQGFARLAAENARKKGYLIRTVPVAGGYVNLMAKRKHYFKGQDWFDEIQHGYTEENRKYLEERGIPASDTRTRYPKGKANDYYRRIRR
jgi:hypothetical protein